MPVNGLRIFCVVSKMKICLLPSWYKTQQEPTLGSFFREQAKALAKQGLDVSMVYCHVLSGSVNKYPHLQQDSAEGFSERIGYARYYFPFTAWVVQAICTLKIIGSIHREGKINIIHAHSFVGGFLAFLALRWFRIPYVLTEHSTKFSRGELTKKDRWMIRLSYKHASKIFAVSEGLRSDMIPFTSKPIEVLVNMVDDEFFDMPINDAKSPTFTFFSVGYLTYKKGMDILIRALADVVNVNPYVILRIGGDGEEKDHLLDLVSQLNLHLYVQFLGALDRDDVVDQMSRCDAFVLASRHETFGIVYLEAMACGKPIIMTDTDAHQMIADPSVGVVVAKEDVGALTEAMIQMADQRLKYDAGHIRTYCRSKFSSQVVSACLFEIYQNLLKEGIS